MSVLTRYRSVPMLESLRREADDLFSQFFPALLEDDGKEELSAMWRPRMDIVETDEAYRMQMDLPGLRKDEVTIGVSDHRLTIRGERKREVNEEKEDFIRRERSYGSFFRSVVLPSQTREEAITANFEDGVLTVVIPKSEEAQPRTIPVK